VSRRWGDRMSSILSLVRSIPVLSSRAQGSDVNCCEWSPSGSFIAVGLKSGDLMITDPYGRKVQTISTSDAVFGISWSPDEKHIALATSRVQIADVAKGHVTREEVLHSGSVWCVAFSPDGQFLASGGEDGRVSVWGLPDNSFTRLPQHNDAVYAVGWTKLSELVSCGNDGLLKVFDSARRQVIQEVKFIDPLLCLSVSADSSKFALGSKNGRIFIFDMESGGTQILEGHTNWVWSVQFAHKDAVLISECEDNTIKFWDANAGFAVATIPTKRSTFGSIAIDVAHNLIATASDVRKTLEIWKFDPVDILKRASKKSRVTHSSAKVALVGESNVGKSCLALRLAEGRYEEPGTTHGMRFWHIPPERLDPNSSTPQDQKREIVLWDMGGQDEYRLIHQLFLHDTSLALILLDPTRGRTAFEEVEGWSKRLEKQLAGRKSTKLLVGSKRDFDTGIIDKPALERLVRDQHFDGYFSTSAKTGRGVSELGSSISKALDWNSLARTSRPYLFQLVRDEIDSARKRGEVVLLRKDLENRVRTVDEADFDTAAVGTVISQLALQGLIAVTRLSSNEQAIVLQIQHIEIYGGSVLIAAKINQRGVPAIQESALMSPEMLFPGLKVEDRLPRIQERIVLECLVQLFIEHGICIEHEGLLVFPSLFQPTESDSKEDFPHSISLYYDFSGAIDNIYSSLISAITISEKFGAIRLWDNRAEFTKSGQGSCGLRKVARQRGFAHLDVYVSDETSEATRGLFVSVVEEHLARYGVDIIEHVEIICPCGYQFSEDTIRKRISDGYNEIGCPECDRRERISEGAKEARQRDPELEKRTWALRSEIRKRQSDVVARAKRNLSRIEQSVAYRPIRILHLSDLHISARSKVPEMLGPLCADLHDRKGGFGFDHLDYLVISGDLTDRAQQSEYEIARTLISGIISEFGLNAERCVIVPGNHDVNWDVDVYAWSARRKVSGDKLVPGTFKEQGAGYLMRNDSAYNERFRSFSDNLYHTLVQVAYPLEPEDQCLDFFFPDHGIQFIGMNSCWELDEQFPERASVNSVALAKGLQRADQVRRSRKGRHEPNEVLRIGVWHHPVTGNEKIEKDAFLEQLRQAGIRLALHGHVHEDRADVVGYLHPQSQLHVVGAGSFGARSTGRPESTPRLYNLIEVSRDLELIRVHTRCLRKEGGAWEGWAVWPGNTGTERRSYYVISV
jgi:GTPase SAR1 family protein